MLVFKGIQKTTLIDFPGEVACTLFLPKCNFRCPYCYNAGLVFDRTRVSISEPEVFGFLNDRKSFLDGVCITGGEPTLHEELPRFCEKLREEGFLVKVDTNGSNPKMLEGLISKGLVDYIAMDVKAPLEKYSIVAGVSVDCKAIEESAELIKNSPVRYEFRTTVLPCFLSKEDLLSIGRWLKGSGLYCLQQFFPGGELIDESLRNARRYSAKQLRAFAGELEGFFERVELRNV